MTPRGTDKIVKAGNWAEKELEAVRRWGKEYPETVRTTAVIAQRVADRAKMLDIPEPHYGHIRALKNAMRILREAENQLRLAGMPSEQHRGPRTVLVEWD